MEISVKIGEREYKISKNKEEMDELVILFTEILDHMKIKYVLISGYVAILFGRSRISEDIDIIVEEITWEKFKELWHRLDRKFWCIITSNPKSAYMEYLKNGTALRFAFKESIIPNIEIKFPKAEIERWVINHPIPVRIDSMNMWISNIEIQIAFKLYLGSEKDIEDAKYLYEIFRDSIDFVFLEELMKSFSVEEQARRYLKWKSQR